MYGVRAFGIDRGAGRHSIGALIWLRLPRPAICATVVAADDFLDAVLRCPVWSGRLTD